MHLSRAVAGIKDDRKQPGGLRAQALPVRVPGRASERRVQHLCDLRALRPPARQRAAGLVCGGVAQWQAWQRAQHRFHIVAGHAPAHAHVSGAQAQVQRCVARRHRAHQHIAAAGRVFGQRVDRHIDTARCTLRIHIDLERIERQPRAPGVVERNASAGRTRRTQQVGQVGKFHRHRAGRLQPDQPRRRCQHRGQRVRIHRIVEAVRDAPGGEFVARQILARLVRVARNQHLVASAQQGQVGQGDRRQSARHQQRLQATFERGDARFERERRRRAVQAVGVAGLFLPLARVQRGGVREDHGRSLEHAGLRRVEAGRRLVRVVNQVGAGRQRRRLTRWVGGGADGADIDHRQLRSAGRPDRGPARRRS